MPYTDSLTKKMKVNEGEVPQYYVENSHPAIVSDEFYEEVQLELERRRKLGHQHQNLLRQRIRQQGLALQRQISPHRLAMQRPLRQGHWLPNAAPERTDD